MKKASQRNDGRSQRPAKLILTRESLRALSATVLGAVAGGTGTAGPTGPQGPSGK